MRATLYLLKTLTTPQNVRFDGENVTVFDGENIIDIGKSDDLETQAQKLFTALREADRMDVDIIYAHLPAQDGIGLALYNRMIRAAAHTIRKV